MSVGSDRIPTRRSVPTSFDALGRRGRTRAPRSRALAGQRSSPRPRRRRVRGCAPCSRSNSERCVLSLAQTWRSISPTENAELARRRSTRAISSPWTATRARSTWRSSGRWLNTLNARGGVSRLASDRRENAATTSASEGAVFERAPFRSARDLDQGAVDRMFQRTSRRQSDGHESGGE